MKKGISQASMELPELAASCNFETGAVVYKGHLKRIKTFFSLGTTNQFWVRYITPFMADFHELHTRLRLSLGAEINYTKCQHTGPNFEAKISRSPALPCPTATCSRQSAPSSQNSRREDGPMSLPPEALELMSCDPLLGRCRKRPDSVQSPTRHRLQRAEHPKKAVYSWADISGRRPFRARTL
jgi:hypothetical protein